MNWKDKRLIAKMISRVENGEDGYEKILREEYKNTGHAHIIGVTGPPGAGKSSLTDLLAKNYVAQGKKVGIIAVDPSSPFSGGAILGDRIRMSDLMTDPNVFIRSMGTRGHLGGLSASTHLVRMVLDAAGADVIFIESVGVGQSEIEIVKTSDTVLMVMVPGLGDDIQGLKAGIMEIGDVFAINKADLPGADRTKLDIENMLSFLTEKEWRPSVTMVSARKKEGIDNLVEEIEKHRNFLLEGGRLLERRKKNAKEVLVDLVYAKLYENVLSQAIFDDLLEDVVEKRMDPYSAVEVLINKKEIS